MSLGDRVYKNKKKYIGFDFFFWKTIGNFAILSTRHFLRFSSIHPFIEKNSDENVIKMSLEGWYQKRIIKCI